MRLATIRLRRSPGDVSAADTAAAAYDGRTWVVLDASDVGELISRPGWRENTEAAMASTSAQVTQADPDFATVVPRPGKIICCGHNYRAHIRELGHPEPTHPTLFAKFADTLTGPQDCITVAGDATGLDWEAELAVVVGVDLRHADAATALAGIAGYTVANDISVRSWQKRTSQWLQGKAFEATTPLGPVMVTPDEVDPAAGLRITTTVNGELVQDSSTADLLFSGADLLAYISQFITLRIGDVVLTGTPGGVGAARTPPRFLADGDRVEVQIENLGRLCNDVKILAPVTA